MVPTRFLHTCRGCNFVFSTSNGVITCGAVTQYDGDSNDGCTSALNSFGGISDLVAAYNVAGGYEGDISTALWPGCLCMALQTLDGKDYNICSAVDASGNAESCNLAGSTKQGNKALPLCGGSQASTGAANTQASTGAANTQTEGSSATTTGQIPTSTSPRKDVSR